MKYECNILNNHLNFVLRFKVVWAETNLVGCGYAHCHDILGVLGHGHRHIFVCHYNPQGNTVLVTSRGELIAVTYFIDNKYNKLNRIIILINNNDNNNKMHGCIYENSVYKMAKL